MDRQIVITDDGSSTLFVPQLNEHYHSTHGAVNESTHVYINEGFLKIKQQNVSILEVGFGTGLNALLTMLHQKNKTIVYHAYELYPLSLNEVEKLDYSSIWNDIYRQIFGDMHRAEWGIEFELTENFFLKKIEDKIQNISEEEKFDLVYFDAFAPDKQNDMWTSDVFAKIYNSMKHGGVLATYCAKGSVRRTMQDVGFTVNRIPGPPKKREMIIAEK